MSYREALKTAIWERISELLELRNSRTVKTTFDNVLYAFKSIGKITIARITCEDLRTLEWNEQWINVPIEAFHLNRDSADVATMIAVGRIKINPHGVADLDVSFDWGQLNQYSEMAEGGLIFADNEKLLDLLYELGTTEPQPEPA